MNGDKGKRHFGEKILEAFGIVGEEVPQPPAQRRYPPNKQQPYPQQANPRQPYPQQRQEPPAAQWQPRKPAGAQYGAAQGQYGAPQGGYAPQGQYTQQQRPADPYGMNSAQQPPLKVYQGGKGAQPVSEASAEPQSIMSLFIRELNDCYKAIEYLMRGVVVLAGLSEKNVVGESQLRFYEVLYGAAVALQAQIMRLGGDWVIIVPHNFTLVGDLRGETRRSGMADQGYVRR